MSGAPRVQYSTAVCTIHLFKKTTYCKKRGSKGVHCRGSQGVVWPVLYLLRTAAVGTINSTQVVCTWYRYSVQQKAPTSAVGKMSTRTLCCRCGLFVTAFALIAQRQCVCFVSKRSRVRIPVEAFRVHVRMIIWAFFCRSLGQFGRLFRFLRLF